MTLADVARASTSPTAFERALRAWNQAVAAAGNRPALRALIHEAPSRLQERWGEAAAADASLAACARRVAALLGEAPPDWSRLDTTNATPAPDLPRIRICLRRGRPSVSAETRRATNAARQRRFQQKRRELLRRLLATAASESAPIAPAPPADSPPAPTITDYRGPD
jgi:hypothetical protein